MTSPLSYGLWKENWAVDWPCGFDVRVANVWDDDLRLKELTRESLGGGGCICRNGDCLSFSCSTFAACVECGKRCKNDGCSNNRLKVGKWCRVQVFDTGVDGRGFRLRSLTKLVKGMLVVEYAGVVRTHHEFINMQSCSTYVARLNDLLVVDASEKGSIARYINHSCSPNCVMEMWIVDGLPRLGIFALQDILKLEELTFDYKQSSRILELGTKCLCGSENCKRVI